MLNREILLLLAGAAMFLAFACGFGRGESWRQVGELPRGFTVGYVAISDDGVGVIGGYEQTRSAEATLGERMSGRTAILWRLEEKNLEKAYEGKGWIVCIHSLGSEWFAVVGSLKASGTGSDYRLIRSSNRAKAWEDLGVIPASSVTQVLAASPSRVYTFGAKALMVTDDAGKNWSLLVYPVVAEGRGFAESIALAQDGGLLAFGTGLMVMKPGTTAWERTLADEYKVEAVSNPYVAAVLNAEVRLLRMSPGGVSKIGELPADRLPVKIAAQAETVRVLTHPRHPEKLGFFAGGLNRVLFRSEDGGKSWKSQRLKGVQKADVSGSRAGIGVDIGKRVFSAR